MVNLITVIVGGQWGDEGKGKLVDYVCNQYDVCCRVNGGSNAGHTIIVNDKKLAMHLIPSSVFNLEAEVIIGNGVVLHLPTLMKEIEDCENNGIPVKNRLFISDRTHIVFNFHQICDQISESHLGEKKIGTTGRGIGPSYMTKCDRRGVRMGLLKDMKRFRESYMILLNEMQKRYNFEPEYDYESELKAMEEYRKILFPMIVETVSRVHKYYHEDKKILIEGANAIMLDIDFGTYPFVTSSNPSIGGVCTGLGVNTHMIGQVYSVIKAYTTRVGEGPFPTELTDEIGTKMREKGHEYGTTTGRPRRCGWIDLPQIKWGVKINGYTKLCLTKIDILSSFKTIKVCVAYKVNGKEIDYYPSDLDELNNVECVYKELDGWMCDVSKVKAFNQFPKELIQYVQLIEEILQIPICWIGTGPERSDIVIIDEDK